MRMSILFSKLDNRLFLLLGLVSVYVHKIPDHAYSAQIHRNTKELWRDFIFKTENLQIWEIQTRGFI